MSYIILLDRNFDEQIEQFRMEGEAISIKFIENRLIRIKQLVIKLRGMKIMTNKIYY